jgi:hypothetical protein
MNPRLIARAVLSLLLAACFGSPLRGQSSSGTKPARQPAPHALQVTKIASSEIKLPPAFEMAIYEYTLEEIKKTGIFQEIYRDGDRRASSASGLVTLRADVRGFKKGSAMARQVTTVSGKTSIKVHMEVVQPDGKVLLTKDLEGKVRFFGENMRATFDLGKGIAHTLKDNFEKPAPSSKS